MIPDIQSDNQGSLMDLYPGMRWVCHWKNGKYGAISTVDNTLRYFFIEYVPDEQPDAESRFRPKYDTTEILQNESPLATGFVSHFISSYVYDEFPDYKIIYESFIDKLKQTFINVIISEPGSWKIEDKVAYIFTKCLHTRHIRDSLKDDVDRLSEYLLDEDIRLLQSVCDDFVEYLEHIIAQYNQKQAEAKEPPQIQQAAPAAEPPTTEPADEEPSDELPTINGTDRETQVFTKAIEKGFMARQKNGTYRWTQSRALLGLMCGMLYCDDRISENYRDPDAPPVYRQGPTRLPCKQLTALFGFDPGPARNQLRNRLPEGYSKIESLFSKKV